MLLADNQLAQRLDVGAPKLAVRIEVGRGQRAWRRLARAL